MRHSHPGNAFIIGGGIAGLACATYLIREYGWPGERIVIYSEDPSPGGALDGSGSASDGFLIRGGRMFEKHFVCTWDLFSTIPTLKNPQQSVTDEVFEFNQQVVSGSNCRLLAAGKKLDVSSYGLSLQQQMALLKLQFSSEEKLAGKRIDEWFDYAFFDTVFWYLWRSTFAFQSWSSLIEMRRYAIRFMHLLPGFNRLEGIMRTVQNQYDSMILPLQHWLEKQGVRFEISTRVTDITFDIGTEHKTARAFEYQRGDENERIPLSDNDCLFVTLGSMVANTTTGSMHDAAPPVQQIDNSAWQLWQRIAARNGEFGRPEVFCGDLAHSQWMSFTCTQTTPLFFEHMERFTGNTAGTGGLVTLTDSNWFMSVVLAHQPHFSNQNAGEYVFWGDGLSPDAPGNFINKPMRECSGTEILQELFMHLGILGQMQPHLHKMNCIPCLMPLIDSQFMPRRPGDRPAVIPEGASNFAFLGQFVEQEEDCVFTVEYSVRSAQTAVFGLLDPDRKPLPVYHGAHDIGVLSRALSALNH